MGLEYYRETIWGIDRKDRRWFQLLTLKELIMPIGDWIREATERSRQQGLAERERPIQQGREDMQQALEEAYVLGYRDAQDGKPEQRHKPSSNGDRGN